MAHACGARWRSSLSSSSSLFPEVRTRKFHGEVIFASVSFMTGDDSHDAGAPTNENIVKSGAHLGIHDMARPVRKLKQEIEECAEIFSSITEGYDETHFANYICGVEGGVRTRAAATVAAIDKDAEGDIPEAAFRVVAEPSVESGDSAPTSAHNNSTPANPSTAPAATSSSSSAPSSGSASADTSSSTSSGTPPNNAAAQSQSSGASHSTTGSALSRHVPAHVDVKLLEDLCSNLKQFRISNQDTALTNEERKKIGHVGHEVVQVLMENDEVRVTPSTGGSATTLRRVVVSRGGNSKRTTSRVASSANAFMKKICSNRDHEAVADIEKRTAAGLNNVVVEFDSKNRQLIIPDEADQITLMEIAGTDRKMSKLNDAIAKITGFLIHQRGFSLAKATDSDLPSFKIYKEELLVDNKPVSRLVYRVVSIAEVICDEISRALNNGVLILGSRLAELEDDEIAIRFLGDKGGNFMAFKFGLSVMNQPQPNATPNFALLGTMEAFDIYYNLEKALFGHWKNELDFLFDDDSSPLAFAVMVRGGGGNVCLLLLLHLTRWHRNAPSR